MSIDMCKLVCYTCANVGKLPSSRFQRIPACLHTRRHAVGLIATDAHVCAHVDAVRAYVPACLHACVPACAPECERACAPECERACAPACAPECERACVPACAPESERACVPACAPECERACVPACLLACAPRTCVPTCTHAWMPGPSGTWKLFACARRDEGRRDTWTHVDT